MPNNCKTIVDNEVMCWHDLGLIKYSMITNTDQCTTGNPVPVSATFSNPVSVPAKYWPDLILIFK